jgi:hypothetical protein
MVYGSTAQPSARGHIFARQGFLECPQDLFKIQFLLENAPFMLLLDSILLQNLPAKTFCTHFLPTRTFCLQYLPH